MEQADNLLLRIQKYDKTFSKGQKRLAAYVLKNYDKAVFLTASKLGKEVGVSESTTVRFATQLGYKGFPEFHRALEELVRNKLNSIQRMKVTYGHVPEAEILDTVFQSDIEIIKLTMEHIDHVAFEMAVETLLSARTIYIIGIRSCAPLASFLSFYLNMILDDVRLIQTSSASEIFEQMIRIGDQDAIIGISFPRYSMRTLKAIEFANNRNAKVITLTDSVHSPINLYSSCNLIARSDMASIVDSLVAPLSVVNALVVALCMKRQKEVVHTLETMEKIWDEYQVYSNDEMEHADDTIKMLNPEVRRVCWLLSTRHEMVWKCICLNRTKNSERNFSLPEKADATLPTAVPQRNCLSPSLPTRAFYTVPSTVTRTTM